MSLGKTIRQLRLAKGTTQEHLAAELHISCQAVSKWEKEGAMPDILLLPHLASYFGVTIDELFGYKALSLTYKERFIKLLHNGGMLTFGSDDYRINTERISNNAQIAQIGSFFADFIRENQLSFDAIMGLAYHGIAFSAATAFALHQKYGIITSYFHDRQAADSRGRIICGYTPQDGDKIIVIDDLMGSGKTLCHKLEQLQSIARVEIAAVIVIADTNTSSLDQISGRQLIEQTYHTKVYSLITDKDIRAAVTDGILMTDQYREKSSPGLAE